LKEALAKSEKPERKAQAAGWKYFKASEPGPNGAVIYVFIMDPGAQGQEYSVGNILVEVLGATEGQALYKTYSDSYANPAIGALLHLTKVAELGKECAPPFWRSVPTDRQTLSSPSHVAIPHGHRLAIRRRRRGAP